MPAIGETLREARMRQRLDIADVESRTKIRAKYLRALENEEWSLLPGPTFVKTFLRTYAEVVGVDPHLLVEEYRVSHEPREDYDFQPLAPRPSREARRPGRRQAPGPPRRGLALAAAVVALLAFLLVLGLLGGDDDGGRTPGATPTEAARRPATETPAKPSRPAPNGVSVRIVPAEPTYACIDTGPGSDVVYEGTLGGPRTFHDPRLLRLNLGLRSVTITLNGRPVRFRASGDPLGLELRRSGSRDLAVGDRPCA